MNITRFTGAIALILSGILVAAPSYAVENNKKMAQNHQSVGQEEAYHLHRTHSLVESPQYPEKPNEWKKDNAGERPTHGGQVILIKW